MAAIKLCDGKLSFRIIIFAPFVSQATITKFNFPKLLSRNQTGGHTYSAYWLGYLETKIFANKNFPFYRILYELRNLTS